VVLAWLVGTYLADRPKNQWVDLISLLAAVSAFGLFAWFHLSLDLRSRYPASILFGGSLCLIGSGYCIWREPSPGVLIRLSLPMVVVGILGFYIFYFSVYWGRGRMSVLRVGDRFPEFSLPNTEGHEVTRSSMLDKGAALMLFYKGDW
jgi:hypothetical protein